MTYTRPANCSLVATGILCLMLAMFPAATHAGTEHNSKKSETPQYRLLAGDMVELLLDFNALQDAPFRFSPGDRIEVRFLTSPELSAEQRVRPDGKIALPYIGDIAVADSTPHAVRTALEQIYEKDLSSPDLVVLLKESGGISSELAAMLGSPNGNRSRVSRVMTDGHLSVPFAGEVPVGGLTLEEARDKIQARYQLLGINIGVDIALSRPEGARISVFGAVNKPGHYVVDKQITIFDALALAGGLTDDAYLSKVLLIRGPAPVSHTQTNLRRLLRGGQPGDIPTLDADDVLYVSRTGIARAGTVARHISEILFFRGFGLDMNNLLFVE